MPEYRSSGGGKYNSGVYPDTRPQIDVGGIFDAIGAGTGSIMRSVIMRRQAEQAMGMQRAELGLRQQQQQRETDQASWERDFKERQFQETSAAQRRADALAGYVPEHVGTTTTPAQTPVTAPTSVSPIRRALMPGQMPGVQVTPSNAPASTGPSDTVNANAAPAAPAAASVTSFTPETTTIPASVDMTKNVGFAKAIDVANARATAAETVSQQRIDAAAKLQKERIEGAQAGRKYVQEQYDLRQKRALDAKAKGPIQKAMTAGQQAAATDRVARGYVAAHIGATWSDLLQKFNDEGDGAKLGLTEKDLMAGFRSAKTDPVTGQILGLIQSGAAVESEKGKGDQAEVARKIIGGAKKEAKKLRGGGSGGGGGGGTSTEKPSISKTEYDYLSKKYPKATLDSLYKVTP